MSRPLFYYTIQLYELHTFQRKSVIVFCSPSPISAPTVEGNLHDGVQVFCMTDAELTAWQTVATEESMELKVWQAGTDR